jgi:hypothetical protein
VGLSAERGALLHRRDDLKARRELLTDEHAHADGERLDVCLEWLTSHHLDDFIEVRGVVAVDDALEEFTPRGSNAEEMRPHLEWIATAVRTAFDRLEDAYPSDVLPPSDFVDLRSRLSDLKPEEREIYESVADRIRRTRQSSRNQFGILDVMPAPISVTPKIVLERHDRAIERTNSLKAQIAALDAEIDLIDEQRERFSRPDGVGSGIAVLSLFAVLGIVFPMVVMALRPVPSSIGVRVALVAAFVIGFGVFLFYLVALVRRLPLGPG